MVRLSPSLMQQHAMYRRSNGLDSLERSKGLSMRPTGGHPARLPVVLEQAIAFAHTAYHDQNSASGQGSRDRYCVVATGMRVNDRFPHKCDCPIVLNKVSTWREAVIDQDAD